MNQGMSGQDNEWVGLRSMVDQEIPQTINSNHCKLWSFSTCIVQC